LWAAQSGSGELRSLRKASNRRAARAAAPGAWLERLCAASSRRLAMLTRMMAANGTPTTITAIAIPAATQI
jgi:hypothetical protein